MGMKILVVAPYGGLNGTAHVGGTSSLAFAEDGDTSSFGPHPTSVFVSFAHLAHQ